MLPTRMTTLVGLGWGVGGGMGAGGTFVVRSYVSEYLV